jgi:hypothetical protein
MGYFEITKSPESTGGPFQKFGAKHSFQNKNPIISELIIPFSIAFSSNFSFLKVAV